MMFLQEWAMAMTMFLSIDAECGRSASSKNAVLKQN